MGKQTVNAIVNLECSPPPAALNDPALAAVLAELGTLKEGGDFDLTALEVKAGVWVLDEDGNPDLANPQDQVKAARLAKNVIASGHRLGEAWLQKFNARVLRQAQPPAVWPQPVPEPPKAELTLNPPWGFKAAKGGEDK